MWQIYLSTSAFSKHQILSVENSIAQLLDFQVCTCSPCLSAFTWCDGSHLPHQLCIASPRNFLSRFCKVAGVLQSPSRKVEHLASVIAPNLNPNLLSPLHTASPTDARSNLLPSTSLSCRSFRTGRCFCLQPSPPHHCTLRLNSFRSPGHRHCNVRACVRV